MRIVAHQKSGIALIVVMISITVLGLLAAGFAYSMKVETKLAQNVEAETELIWQGRSGVEAARYVLALTALSCPYDAPNQKWANGPGDPCETNGPLAGISLAPFSIGGLSYPFSIKITDAECKYGLNRAANDPELERVLQQALQLVGVDPVESSTIVGSILDWIDDDDHTHIGGAEESYYQGFDPPYIPKNGPIGDLSELLLIKGIRDNPAIYSKDFTPAAFQRMDRHGRPMETPNYPVHLNELFTPISNGRININTASREVLMMVVGDENIVDRIDSIRKEGDGFEPYVPVGRGGKSIGYVLQNAGINPGAIPQIEKYFGVKSQTFEVQVDTEVAGYKPYTFYATIARNNPHDVKVLSFYWKPKQP